MRVIMVGVSHQTAGLDLRERLALAGPALDRALERFRAAFPAAEAVLLSTCNRTELYVARPIHEAPSPAELRAYLAQAGGADLAEVTAATIHREGQEAIAHLFRVAAGLESLVLGEPQILGQVKRAYEQACAARSVGATLHRVLQQAMAVAKEVRTRTGIGAGRLSVGSVAVDFARRIFAQFDDKTLVALGAGDMAKLALTHLIALRPARLWLANRTPERAQELWRRCLPGLAPGQAGGVRSFEDLEALLVEADIVLSGTASPQPIVTAERFRRLAHRRRGRPLFVIDIALPRDFEPAIGGFGNVYLYNLDDLSAVVARTRQERAGEVQAAEALVLERVQACLAGIAHQDLGQIIKALRERLHALARAERERTLRKLAAAHAEGDSAALEQALDEHSHRLVNKVLHLPLSQLDALQGQKSASFYAAALRTLFDLGEAAGQSPSGAGPAAGREAVD